MVAPKHKTSKKDSPAEVNVVVVEEVPKPVVVVEEEVKVEESCEAAKPPEGQQHDSGVEEELCEEKKEPLVKKECKTFSASQGRLRKLFLKSGLTGRISKDVFDILDKKIKCLAEQRIKTLVVKDKHVVLENVDDEKEKVCELPITPFRDYIKSLIKKEYDISRVSPDIIESLHYQIEKDAIKLCQYAQEIMKNSTRKTLFSNDIDVASKAILRES
jgi:histone H3/H4